MRFVWVYQELCPANSVDFARKMLAFFPFPVGEIQTDHGIEFTYIFMPWVKKPHPFEELLKEMGIRHKLIPIATPKQNGRVERSHRTDEKNFITSGDLESLPGGEESYLISSISTITSVPTQLWAG